MKQWLVTLVHFGVQEALSCLFPVLIFASLALTQLFALPQRYDWMLVICLLIQWGMYRSGLETRTEIALISLFHLIGLIMELYKVHMGSWSYPEYAWTKIGGVPLYSGFLYASVASYIMQAWKRLQLSIQHWPSLLLVIPLGMLIYANFFTHHFLPDMRWILMALLVLVFWPTSVYFTVNKQRYRMPLLLAFLLIGFFIWLAENIATYFHAWAYPQQLQSWHPVSPDKISSWFLFVLLALFIISPMKQAKHYTYKPG
uniref:DUF817 domain-containing protein n=1 Tax=Thermosporothrix sp. COM3 TaxID=2490863 RepID=A0A455SR55_9CHLR|nr:hypothetical protein KTC_23850 [Thermosporothrix sp. COM3]